MNEEVLLQMTQLMVTDMVNSGPEFAPVKDEVSSLMKKLVDEGKRITSAKKRTTEIARFMFEIAKSLPANEDDLTQDQILSMYSVFKEMYELDAVLEKLLNSFEENHKKSTA